MKRFTPVVAVLILILTGVSLAGPADSPMVGKWMAVSYAGEEIPEGMMWVENHDDGTGTMHEKSPDGQTSENPYTWSHDEQAGTCTIVADGEEMTFDVVFGDDDTCTFTDPDNPDEVMVMKRMAE